VYPDELDQYFGDPILFKVRKNRDCHACGANSLEVIDMMFHHGLLEIYQNQNSDLYLDKSIELKSKSFSKMVIGDNENLVSSVVKNKGKGVVCYKSDSDKLSEFIGKLKVYTLRQLCASKDIGEVVCMGWYESVVEGVDMWYVDDRYCFDPRCDIIFILF
jgi:hypothetical protein